MILSHKGAKGTKNNKGIWDKNDFPKPVFSLVVLSALCVFVVQSFVPCSAQTVYSSAGLATPLSLLCASARADALGGALTGLSGDTSDLFYNAAGLSQLNSASLCLNHNSYLAGSFEETLLFGLPVAPLGGFALALQYVSWGGLDERDSLGVSLGNFSDSDVAFSAGWGLPVVKGFSLGIALHGVQQKIVASLYTGLSGDVGLLWSPNSQFQLGLVYTGLGTTLAGFTPVQDLRLGVSSLLGLGRDVSLRPLLAGDWQPNGVSRIQGGLEGVLQGDYFLRLGYQAALEDNQVGGLTGFTAGAGVRISQFQLDYAFVPYGDLGSSHRVSVGYEFPNPNPVVPKPVTVLSSPVTVQAPPVTVVATPVPVAAGPPKTKVEVLFDLPGTGTSQGKGQATTSLTLYEKAARDNPRDSRAWRNLGIVYLRAGQTALGVQCLEQAFRLNANDPALKKWLEEYRAQHPGKP